MVGEDSKNGLSTLSPEETDALACSRKKVRTDEGRFSNDQILVPRVEEWMKEKEGQTSEGGNRTEGLNAASEGRKSYKKAFMQADESDAEEDDLEDGWWNDDKWKEMIKIEDTERGPNVIIPNELKARLVRKYRKSVFVKLLGAMVREDYLSRKLQQIWGGHGEVETIDIGSGFFLVNFKSRADYTLALTGGPCFVMDHCLAVQPWREDFEPENEAISHIALWIQIPSLPMDYYDKGMFYVLGSQVGKVLKVDMTTLNRKKGRFARICVDLDLTKPLRPFIQINGKEKRIEYEGLHLICFCCGKYGHNFEQCKEKGGTDHSVSPAV